MLTGRTFCTECGCPISGGGSKRSGGNGKGKLNYYYKCVGKTKYKNGCQSRSLNKDVFEPKVLETLMNVVMDKEQINQIAKMTFAELEAMRDTPVVTTAQLKKELADIVTKQTRLRDLYVDGLMEKSILDEKNGELNRRKYQLEDELEKRKHIENSEDVTEEDIECFIVECIEQIKNSYDQTDDEFMRIMFNTFIERVDVSNEKITIHIRMDFSIMSETVTNRQLSGVFHSLPTVTMERVIKRKKHVHGRNF